MPIFYAMAGFFTALLIARYGLRRAAWNRFMRIAVPFVVGWIVVWPWSMFLAGTRLLRPRPHAARLRVGRGLRLRPSAASVVPRIPDRALRPGRDRAGGGAAGAVGGRAQGGAAGPSARSCVAVGAAGAGGAVVRRAAPDAQSLDRGSAGLHPGVPHRRGLRRPVRLRLAAVPAERSPGRTMPAAPGSMPRSRWWRASPIARATTCRSIARCRST